MTTRRALKLTHIVSTVLFMVCVCYILALTLREAGVNWWLIFSLSGHSALVVLLLMSLYLFAFFRGVGGAQQIEVEHPLTTTSYYLAFYVAAPLLGALAGVLGMIGVDKTGKFLLGVSLGTLGTTFLVWVVVDPAVGLIEMLLPLSRKHRAERLAEIEAGRRARQERREQLLTEAFAREEQELQSWQQRLQPEAERLAVLLASDASVFERAEQEAVAIGARAWQLGGIHCMRQLHDMAISISRGKSAENDSVDYISYWWDGIGNWRRPSLG